MNHAEKLKDIQEHPEQHHHTFEALKRCCIVDGVLDCMLMEAHPSLGTNGGQKCDVTSGPCACGSWH